MPDSVIMRRIASIFLALVIVCAFVACNTSVTPRPTAYPRIIFPEKTTEFRCDYPGCPYTFVLPGYYTTQRKTQFFDEDISNDCWLNVECTALNATIYLSYKTLSPGQTLLRLVEEAYNLTYKHTGKADYIQPREIDNGHGGVGLIYYVGGEAASNIQFFITDTVSNFVRGALYIYSRPNADSLKPVVDFLVDDIEGILQSWRWKTGNVHP